MKANSYPLMRPTRWLFLAFLLLTLLPGLRPTPPAIAAFSTTLLDTNSQLAFASVRDGNAEIYRMNADGSNQTRLTNNPAYDAEPSWSPDGTKIAFRSDRDGDAEIYLMNANGSGQTNLTNNAAHDYMPAWSPDGTKIAFASERDGNQEIYVMNTDGSDQTNLTNSAETENDRDPAWSPDSNQIAFARNASGHVDVYVMDANGDNQTNISDFPNAADDEPTWSPDGTKIVFTTSRDGSSEVYIMNTDGDDQTNLSNSEGVDYQPTWSLSGDQIAFTTDRDGNYEIYAMNTDGSGPTNLTEHATLDYLPDWGAVPSDEDDDGVGSAIEAGAPNNGDGNDDGVPDSLQEHVASLPNSADGSYLTLAAPDGTQLSDVFAVDNPSPADVPTTVDFPIGFLDFHVEDLSPGGMVTVELFLANGTAVDSYYKYDPTPDNPANHWYPFLYNGTTGAEFLSDRILLHFVDGQRGDADLAVNGVISDPSAAANCVPLTGVTILGPANGQTGQPIVFRADVTPGRADDPPTITYNWSPPPDSTQGRSATYTFNSTGNKMISVTVSNCGGDGTASDNHPINISSSCTNLSGVTINGPTNGVTGQSYQFTANVTPPSATGPFTYTWSPPPGSGQGTSQASYVWNNSGNQPVNVSVSNCGGSGTANDSYTITITPSCTPLTAVAISGPTNGVSGQSSSFTASVTPAAATPPISFVWTPEPDSGQGTAAVSYTWNTAGEQTITVNAGNCGGAGTAAADHPITITSSGVKVINESGNPIAGATIYRNGTAAGHTDSSGVLNIANLQPNDQLVATQLIEERLFNRDGHSQNSTQNWAYRVYLTSLDIPRNGEPAPFLVTNPTNTVLTIKKANTLIGFNIVVAVEWDASADYLEGLRQGFEAASRYLYDASDGQMVFEQVSIYDNGQYLSYWHAADFNIFARNILAFRPGRGPVWVIPSPSYSTGLIRFGRYYDGRSSNQGPWTQPAGYRSLIRAFANYGFDLRDSDGYYDANEQWKSGVNCTSPNIATNTTDDLNATLMAYQFNATEFYMRGFPALESTSCQQTDQWKTYEQSDWETIQQVFSDTANPARWTIKTPAAHGGVVAGPHAIPIAGWSTAAIGNNANTGTCATLPAVRAIDDARTPVSGAWTVLEKQNGRVIEQGETAADGLITILGAANGDEVLFRGGLSQHNLIGRTTIACTTARSSAADPITEVVLNPAAFALAVATTPGNADNEVIITVKPSAALNAPPTVTLHQVGAINPLPVTMQFNSSLGAYRGLATLDVANPALGLSATIAVHATDTQVHSVHTFTTFEMTPVVANQDATLLSADGRAQLHLPAGTLSANGRVNVEAADLPQSLPDDLVTVSGPYTISAESGVTLADPATLTLRYLDVGGTLGHVDLSTARIYRWNGSQWNAVNGISGPGSVSASISMLGTYALAAELSYPIYLPVGIR